ncbi:penicillin-binding protein 2 [Motiliproteus coralliicola]|uniref:Peptidoglycan D,D-transpeptidase FtsI n=1 Tax=Motiliproteus coralliicola TaxID=2283196 RepID=A0A369WQE6_9GAMM|nr:penicillin-binding transpeptidase domain-containing protein [Motiliproteus coralliicola]RDE22786.1 penicillin-binding protein 2 [Motiliproteus coralliicola]
MSEPVILPYRWRFRLVLLMLSVLALVIAARIVHLHLFEDDFLKGQGDARSLRVVPIPAHRGMILDRNGEPLAVSAPVQSLWFDPRLFSANEAQIKALARSLELSVSRLERIIDRSAGKKFVYLRRHMAPADAENVLALGLDGVFSQSEYKRYYPAAEVATHLVGFTNVDGQGQEGMELAYENWLRGEKGKKRVLKDRLGRTIKEIQALKEAKPGQDLQLSIDLRLQYLAYRELKAAVQQHRARSGSAVVLDVQTGEVLAMVNQPSYNPNDRSDLKASHVRNRAMTDTFEPGSPMKALTVAAAMSSGKYSANSKINTSPGYIRVRNRTIRDHRNYGVLDLGRIISKSSNVGATKLALSIEPGAVRNMMYNAGLGRDTGTGFPGERVGSLPFVPEKRVVERAAMSYGYGLSVTPLQLAQAYLAFGGEGVKPDLSLLKVNEDEGINSERIMPEKVARQVLEMMEQVTLKGGTGRRAQVPAFRVAGKTGTVHKVGRNGYEEDQYVAVFAGLAPVENPRFVAVVVVDEPKGQEYYGGEVAAPVFSRIMAGTLRLMNVAPDKLPMPLEQQLAWSSP